MEKENELYDVSVIKPEYLVEPFEDNSPIYLCITEEQLVLLMWLKNHGFLELNQNDIPPSQINLAREAEEYKEARC